MKQPFFDTNHSSCRWVLLGRFNLPSCLYDCNQFQNSSDSSMIIFHSHSLSSTLTRPIVPLEVLTGNSTTWKEEHNIWSWPKVDGKLSCWCLSSCAYSCGVALSSKEMSWVLKYTKNIIGGEWSGSRMISWVKLGSILTIYGNIWHPKHKEKGNVSKSPGRSLPIYSEHLSELQSGIW